MRKFQLPNILRQLPAQSKGKQAQGHSACQVHPAEEGGSDKPASPGDQGGHEEAPEQGSTQEAGKEDNEMYRLGSVRYGSEYRRAKPRPKNNVEWISKGEKGAVGKIPAAGSGGCSV